MKHPPNALQTLVRIVVLARILQIYPIILARVLIVSPTKTAKQ